MRQYVRQRRRRCRSEEREVCQTPELLANFENLHLQLPSEEVEMNVDDDDQAPQGSTATTGNHGASPPPVERPPTSLTATNVESGTPTPPARSTVKPNPWNVSLARFQNAGQAAALFDVLQQKTKITSNGRVITVPEPITVNLSKVQRTWLRRGLFLTVIPAGSVRVVEGVFPCKGYKIRDLKSPTDYRANAFLCSKTLDEFIYLREKKRYWVVPNNYRKGSQDGYFLSELPLGVITPEYRQGYRDHLQDERALDEANPARATYESRNSFQERLAQMASWVHEDQFGHAASLQEFLDSRAVKTESVQSPPAPAASSMEDDEVNLNDLLRDPPPPPSLDDEVEEPELAEITTPSPSNSEAGMTLKQKGIQHLVNRPFRDAGYLKAAEDWRPQLLKLRPDLRVCRLCGDKSHASARCTRSLSGSYPQVPSEGLWGAPEPNSLAAKMVDSFVCPYPFCRDKTVHILSACDDLHRRCARCRARGHSDEMWDAPEQPGHYITHCPVVATDQNSRIADSATSPTWNDLLSKFEAFASSGEMTKFRFHLAGCGFFPASGEGDLEVLKALGYRQMGQLAADEAISLVGSIHTLCAGVFGTRSLQFTEFTDSEWNTVFQRREAKRSREIRESQAQAKEASRAKVPKAPFRGGYSAKSATNPPNAARTGQPATAGSSSRSESNAPFLTPQVYPGTHAPMLTPQVYPPLPAGDPNPPLPPTPSYGAAAARVQPSFGYVNYSPEQLAKWQEMSKQAPPPPPRQGFKRIPKTGKKR